MLYTTEEFKLRYDLYLNSTAQYVFLSSSRVYAESKTPIKEESPRLLDVCTDEAYIATDEYAIAKARQEYILKKSERRNWTVIRPYVTFSEIRLQLSPLEKCHRKGNRHQAQGSFDGKMDSRHRWRNLAS